MKLFDTFFHLLQRLFGVTQKTWTVVAPILTSEIGNFLAAAVPVAERLVVVAIQNGGKLDDDSRKAAATQLQTLLVAEGVSTGIRVTNGLLKYAVDTAYHSLKAQDRLPPVPAAPAMPSNIINLTDDEEEERERRT